MAWTCLWPFLTPTFGDGNASRSVIMEVEGTSSPWEHNMMN